MELTIDTIKELVKLVTTHKLDKLRLGDLEITKSRHESAKDKTANNSISISDEELLYMSGAPALTAEEIAMLTDNPMPLPPTKRSKKKE